jgi:hypothetical protein
MGPKPFPSGTTHNPWGTAPSRDSGSSWLRSPPSVTTRAGIRRIVVIAVVASRAIVRDCRVRPVQRIIIVVDRERRWFPARGGRVAHRAIRWDVQGYVVRVGRLREIGGVTAVTSIRRIGVIPLVTSVTIAGNRNVRSRKRINSTVVKRRRRPRCFRVAGGAIRWELRRSVIRVRGTGVIRRVAAIAGIWRGVNYHCGKPRSHSQWPRVLRSTHNNCCGSGTKQVPSPARSCGTSRNPSGGSALRGSGLSFG